MKTVTCTALTFFLDFVPDHGQVHGDPNSDDKAVRFPEVPESYVDTLVDAGKIKVGSPKGKIEAPEASLSASIDYVMERLSSAEFDPGAPVSDLQPRELADGEKLAAAPLFTVTHVSGPNFDVFGPGMDAPERIKGKAAAEARAAELEAAMAEPIDAPDPDGGWEPATEDAAPL